MERVSVMYIEEWCLQVGYSPGLILSSRMGERKKREGELPPIYTLLDNMATMNDRDIEMLAVAALFVWLGHPPTKACRHVGVPEDCD